MCVVTNSKKMISLRRIIFIVGMLFELFSIAMVAIATVVMISVWSVVIVIGVVVSLVCRCWICFVYIDMV